MCTNINIIVHAIYWCYHTVSEIFIHFNVVRYLSSCEGCVSSVQYLNDEKVLSIESVLCISFSCTSILPDKLSLSSFKTTPLIKCI